MRPAGTARQCRDQAGDRCVMVTIERAQIDCIYRSAARAPYPQEPMTRGDGGADGRSLLTRKRRNDGVPLTVVRMRNPAKLGRSKYP